ncbi:cupin domain-containing protein [Lichenifustis flavocetrariae]|uniref:Cupin domain-containing protein n=1 Tax=Lichenifustis flavocetrariae TaxID=2949735 RepID=A0AA42CM62_9HYPH|nr:cupin domain-containing protein [Lichenifustis flavocetrariae]MCW6511206.1 cupin domain-containing protein [Lichenifustis flavocetrariae]
MTDRAKHETATPESAPDRVDPSAAKNEVQIGGKLKHARLRKSWTLRQVSLAAGCSESMLSKIENGRATPSLPTLHRIAASLDTTVSALLSSTTDDTSVVARPEDRPTYVVKDQGIRLERLITHVDGNLLQGNIHWIEPGASAEEIVAHQGEELGYILEGEIVLLVDGKSFVVGEGASFHFRSEMPHAYRNEGKSRAKILWVSTPPTF